MADKDWDQPAALAAALKAVTISETQLEEIRRLYLSPQGYPFSTDKKNAPQGETIDACRKVGSSIKRYLGITSAQPYGMNFVGHIDPATLTWRMNANFRAALESLRWFDPVPVKKEFDAKGQLLGLSFEVWLIEHGTSPNTAGKYARAILGRLKDLATQLEKPSFTVAEIDSAAAFEKFCKAYDQSNKIHQLNVNGNNMYSAALVWYAKYLADQATPTSLQQLEERLRARVSQSLKDSSAARAARLASASKIPKTISVTTVAFERNPDVVAQVLDEADGTCQGCGKEAPFKRKSDNSPYLEVHHRIPLSAGGEDTVTNAIALCPNCHRKLHYGV
jgi:hypothetical protein